MLTKSLRNDYGCISGRNHTIWAGKMVQPVKVLAGKPDDLSLIPGTQKVGENHFLQVVDTLTSIGIIAHPPQTKQSVTHTHHNFYFVDYNIILKINVMKKKTYHLPRTSCCHSDNHQILADLYPSQQMSGHQCHSIQNSQGNLHRFYSQHLHKFLASILCCGPEIRRKMNQEVVF